MRLLGKALTKPEAETPALLLIMESCCKFWKNAEVKRAALVLGLLLFVQVPTVTRVILLWMKVETETRYLQEQNYTTADLRGSIKVVGATIESLHVLELIVLALGVWKFLKNRFSLESRRKKIWDAIWDHMFRAVFVIFSFVVFLVVSLYYPMLDIIQYQDDTIMVAYEAFTIVSHLITVAIRAAFAYTVLVVCIIWSEEIKVLNEGTISDSDEKRAAKLEFKTDVAYRTRAHQVIPMLGIFEEWFVIQWILYLFAAFFDFWLIFEPHLEGTINPESNVHQASLYLRAFYIFMAFIIPYLIGINAHRYHRMFYKKLTENMKQEAAGQTLPSIPGYDTKVRSDDVEKGTYEPPDSNLKQLACVNGSSNSVIEECDFVPNLHLIGISIPINGPGFAVGILLIIFVLLGGVFSSS